jgi:ribosomal protein L11 methyltransferase
MPTTTTPKTLWEITVSTHPEAEEAVTHLLESITHHPPSSYHNLRHNLSHTSAYLPTLPSTTKSLRQQIQTGLKTIQTSGLQTHPGKIKIQPIPQKNWAESWKEHFPPLEIPPHFLILPDWITPPPNPTQHVITLNPGLSFGTGHHPTTQFCLEELARALPNYSTPNLLDIGTGSGLLAIAAAKLQYHRVTAFDFDPVAVKIAKQNARKNQVGRKIRFYHDDITHPTRPIKPHHVVCANLQANLLTQEAQCIAQSVLPNGTLILAGILHKELPTIQTTFSQLGFEKIRAKKRKEWSSISLHLPA